MIEPKSYVDDEVDLQHYFAVLRRRRWTVFYTVLSVFVLGAVGTALMTPIYEADAKLLVRASAPQISAMNTENPLVDLLAMAQPESVDTQIELLQSGPFLSEVFVAAGVPPGGRAPQVRVAGVKDTNLIEVRVQSPDRQLAARVANTTLDHYLDRTRLLSLQEITRAREFVERQAQRTRKALQRAEGGLLHFRRDNRVAELTAEQQNRTQELVEIETRSRETRNNVIRLQAQMGDVREQLTRQPPERIVATGEKNPRVDALQARLAEATVERAALLKSFRPASPKVQTVDARIEILHTQIAAEPLEQRVPLHVPNDRHEKLVDRLDGYQTELEGQQAQSTQLEAQLWEKRRRMNQLGPWEVRLSQLLRERDMAEKSYLSLAGKLEDLQIRENARRSTARVIERATPPGAPIRPRQVTNLALALATGLLLGVCLAFLLESLDDRITTAEEVDRLLGLPVMGYIPMISGERRLLNALPSHSSASESYRGLRSSISFSSVDAPVTTLGLTSARAGEGKTTTTLNLALAMAADDRSVIVVDADLRRPSLHKMLDLPISPGLTDVLTGECSLDDALKALVHPQVLVLTAGAVPPNPAEMLNTAGMEALIRQLRERADVVLFDTPPCVPVTDAQVLGAKLDGMLLVAEMGESRRGELMRARELLDQAHIRLLGVVFNKISSENRGYHYGRYQYYHPSPYHADAATNGNGNGHQNGTLLPQVSSPAGRGASTAEQVDAERDRGEGRNG